MAIVANTVSQVGDVLYIKTQVPVVGIIMLSGFTDVTTENGSNVFDKQFRYTQNGITYSDWLPLTTNNLTSIPVTQYDSLSFEYKYTNKSNTQLSLTSVTLNTDAVIIENGDIFNNSIFAKYFDCSNVDVLQWYLNVTEKLYSTGILAKYIRRIDDANSPEDFILFWKSITKFFAFYVVYARKWRDFHQDNDLIKEYLRQRGLYVSEDQTIQECQILMQTYNQQVASRGTFIPTIPSRNVNNINVPIDGEILRLINHVPDDEFLFNPYADHNSGWNIDNCSPMYTGLEGNETINKFYEQNSITDITKYPILKPSDISIIVDGTENVFYINTADTCGIGWDDNVDNLKTIFVSEKLDYQFSFQIKKDNLANFAFGIECYDINNIPLGVLLASNATLATDSLALTNQGFPNQNKYCTIKCALYNSSTTAISGDKLNINVGNNLIMPATTAQIIPKIFITNGTGYLKNIKFMPLQTEYDRCFLQVTGFISTWLVNRNQHESITDLEDILKNYFIQYSNFIKITGV